MRRRAALVAANLIAPLGLLSLDWNVVGPLFLVWLDVLIFAIASARAHTWMLAVPLVAGALLLDRLEPYHLEGPLAAVLANRWVLVCLAIQLALRLAQMLPAEAAAPLRALGYRLVILTGLFLAAALWGREEAIVFLLAATVLMTFAEVSPSARAV